MFPPVAQRLGIFIRNPALLGLAFTWGRAARENWVRCYFMKDGHIAAVEYLHRETDGSRIAEARELFELKGRPRGAEGFEVWDGPRFVYRYPETDA